MSKNDINERAKAIIKLLTDSGTGVNSSQPAIAPEEPWPVDAIQTFTCNKNHLGIMLLRYERAGDFRSANWLKQNISQTDGELLVWQ